MQGC
jgi:hypothetical protein